jgi:hypothetical protein
VTACKALCVLFFRQLVTIEATTQSYNHFTGHFKLDYMLTRSISQFPRGPAETVSAGSSSPQKFYYFWITRRIRSHMRNGFRPCIRTLSATVPLTNTVGFPIAFSFTHSTKGNQFLGFLCSIFYIWICTGQENYRNTLSKTIFCILNPSNIKAAFLSLKNAQNKVQQCFSTSWSMWT